MVGGGRRRTCCRDQPGDATLKSAWSCAASDGAGTCHGSNADAALRCPSAADSSYVDRFLARSVGDDGGHRGADGGATHSRPHVGSRVRAEAAAQRAERLLRGRPASVPQGPGVPELDGGGPGAEAARAGRVRRVQCEARAVAEAASRTARESDGRRHDRGGGVPRARRPAPGGRPRRLGVGGGAAVQEQGVPQVAGRVAAGRGDVGDLHGEARAVGPAMPRTARSAKGSGRA